MKNAFVNHARRWGLLLLCLLMVLSVLGGCAQTGEGGGEGGGEKPSGEPTVITFGTHARYDDDPTYVDPVTGESPMTPEVRAAYLKAMEAVEEQLNVKIEWVEYQENAAIDILRSMLANDPICDLALCVTDSQGTLLGQNVFQELDDYAHLFEGEEYEWMWIPSVLGHNYLLNCDIRPTDSMLSFNISMLDAVDALKDSSGNTVYPTDLYKKGEWTWSKFREYLTKVDAYYNGKTSTLTGAKIYAFNGDAKVVSRAMIHSAGGAIYTSDGIRVGKQEDLDAMEYLQDLYDRGLFYSKPRSSTNPITVGQPITAQSFADGESVFATLYPWGCGSIGGALADRGESMGLVPYPIVDGADKDDPKYAQFSFFSDTCSVVRGLPAEKVELILKAYRLYYNTYYMERYDLDTMVGFREATAEAAALADGFDVYHEKIGQDIVDMYQVYYGAPVNDLASAVSLHNEFLHYTACASIFGIAKGYAVNVKEQLPILQGIEDTIRSALSSGKLVDITPPVISAKAIPVPLGGSEADVKEALMQYVKINDTMDGTIDASSATVDVSEVNFNAVGDYFATLKAYDSSLNEATANVHIYVYNANNKTAPTLTVKSTLPLIRQDTDVSTLKWSDYVEEAVDADGLNLIDRIKADVSTLDTSMEGTYDVTLTVTDFAGNTADAVVSLTVLNLG